MQGSNHGGDGRKQLSNVSARSRRQERRPSASPPARRWAVAAEALEGRQLFAVDFTLQLLHASDYEAGLSAVGDAPRFAAVVDALEDTLPNTIRVASGDNYIPGPFFNAGGDPALNPILGTASVGRADVEILNRIGIEASTIGNHEFDAGPREFRNIFAPAGSGPAAWRGAQFPYLSSNLNFATDPDLGAAAVNAAAGQEAATVKGKLAKSTVITVNGEKIGIVGATTPQLESISSTGGVGVTPANDNDIAALAAIIQPEVDALRNGQGIDKIIVATHLQQISFEQQLAPLLSGVDILIAGGSNTILADANDRLRTGDAAAGPYPTILQNRDGQPIALVNTDGNYRYVGRLVARFDAAGVLVPPDANPSGPLFDPAESGAYAADDRGVTDVWTALRPGQDPFGPGTKGAAVRQVTDAVVGVINTKDAQLFGRTSVYLEGRRNIVRTQETNLGSLTADANLSEAQDTDDPAAAVLVSIKNGGGIRDSIGSFDADSGTPLPPAENPTAGKRQGDVSQLDVENSLRFNNLLTALSVSASNLKVVLEHAVAAVAPGATPGQFPQIGGLAFSFDPARPAQATAGNAGTGVATITTPGQRIRSAAVVNDAGVPTDVLVRDGAVVGDPSRLVRLVTLTFLADDPDNDGRGGDNYPLPSFDVNRVDLGVGEQAALGEYLIERFPVSGNASFNQAETAPSSDLRIQNLSARQDAVLPTAIYQFSAGAYIATEGGPAATVTVSRTGNLLEQTTVNYATSDGTALAGQDYTATSGTLTFALGEASKTFAVPILDDANFEFQPPETINLTLSGPTGGTLGTRSTAELRIADNEPRGLFVDDAAVREGNDGQTTLSFRVGLGAATGVPVTVSFATADGRSTPGSDYVPRAGTLTFQAGESAKIVDVLINGDKFSEPSDFLFLNLSNPAGATLGDAQGVGKILDDDAPPAGPSASRPIRFSTFNASLNRNAAGQLVADLSTPNNAQASASAEIIQRSRPDVLLVNEFDYVPNNEAANLFRQNYLKVGQNGAAPIDYSFVYVAPSNTGVASGFDLDNSGAVVTSPGSRGYGEDALGFGAYEGQFGMAVFSRFPIDAANVRTFKNFLWKDMPGALLPDDAATAPPADFYSPQELAVLPLSSKSHWDVPVNVNGSTVHLLAAHPTPPVFDGPEDRNGRRNHDEIRLWADYVRGGATAAYLYDDAGRRGGLAANSRFVIAGDYNADPLDGDSVNGAINQLLQHPSIDDRLIPTSLGAVQQNALQGGVNVNHRGNPAFDTADFNDAPPGGPGNLRVDYVLPSHAGLETVGSGVFWPARDDPRFAPVGVFPFPSSDHRLVFRDVRTTALPQPVAPGLSINDVRLAEGNSGLRNFTFTVKLSMPATSQVKVGFATQGESASGASDYLSSVGRLTFAPGQTSRTITVKVKGDRTKEASETFRVKLFDAVGATLTDAVGRGTIFNDD